MEYINFDEIKELTKDAEENFERCRTRVYDYITDLINKKDVFGKKGNPVIKKGMFSISYLSHMADNLGFTEESYHNMVKVRLNPNDDKMFLAIDSERFMNFLGFKLGYLDDSKDYNVNIKLYFRIDFSNVRNLFDEISEYCYNAKIETSPKSRYSPSNDMVTVRINDYERIDDIVNIIKKYQVEDDRTNQFIPKYNDVGFTFDFEESYNSFLSRSILEYVMANKAKELSDEGFYEFIKNKLDRFYFTKEDYIYLENLKLAMGKKELTKDYIIDQAKYINDVVVKNDKELEEEANKRKKLRTKIVTELSNLKEEDIDKRIEEFLKRDKLEEYENYTFKDIFYDMSEEEIVKMIKNACKVIKAKLSKRKIEILMGYANNILSSIIFNAAIKIEKKEDISNYLEELSKEGNIFEGVNLSLLDIMNYYINNVLEDKSSFKEYVTDNANMLIEDRDYIMERMEKECDKSKLSDFSYDEEEDYYEMPYDLINMFFVMRDYDISINRIDLNQFEDIEDINDIPTSINASIYYSETLFEKEIISQQKHVPFPGYAALVFKQIAYKKNYGEEFINSKEFNLDEKVVFMYCTDYLKEKESKLKR